MGFLTDKFLRSSGLKEDNRRFPTPPAEKLTAGEKALVKSIFGDELKTRKVRKYFSPKKRFNSVARAFGKYSIKFYGDKYKSADYSQTGNVYNYGTFIHEMTHLWQDQNPAAAQHAGSSYDYKFYPGAQFERYSWEQQAAIIEDYARQFLFLPRKTAKSDLYLPSNAKSANKSRLCSRADLQKIVEDRFPEARKTRLAREAPPLPPSP